MRRVIQFLLALMVILLSAVSIHAQSLSAPCSLILNSPLVVSCPAVSNFTLVNGSYVRLNPQSNAIQNATTSDAATQVVGVPLKRVQSNVIIQTSGLMTVNFDGATSALDTFTMSTTTPGYLHDTGSTACSSTTLGVINQTIGAAGQATVYWGTCQPTTGAGTVWGGIIGTLSSQTDLQTALNAKAPLASPTFTGVPAAPTATGGTNTTQLATTAFVQAALPATVTCTAPQFLIATGTCATPVLTENSQSAAYTTVLGDAGKMILHPSTDNNARTFTIDSNANVAYPTGTCLTFVNMINTVTIAITSDTMTLMGSNTTGSRTLAVGNWATACKIDSTSWVIGGSVGLT